MFCQHFTVEEREIIAIRLAEGENKTQIARELDRHHPPVSNKIQRNSNRDGSYSPIQAQLKAECRRRESKTPWKMNNPKIAKDVKENFKQHWSSEQIAGCMAKDHPEVAEMRISYETIYAWIRRDKKQGGQWRIFIDFPASSIPLNNTVPTATCPPAETVDQDFQYQADTKVPSAS